MGLLLRGKATFEMGGITESAQVIEAALLDPPDGWALRRLHALAAQVSIVLGSFEDAARHIEAARIPSATPEDEDRRGYLAIVRAELARSQNRLEDVRAIIGAAAPGVIRFPNDPDINEMIWRLVEIGLDVEAVRAELGRAADDAAAVDQAKESATTLVDYLTVVRRQREAERVRDATRQRAEDALIEGHLARIEDRDDPSLWVTAAAMFPPRSPHALRAHYLQAEAMLAARVPRDEIRAVMADAHAIAVEIGAGLLAGRFEELARRARITLIRAPAAVVATEQAATPEDSEPSGVVALRARGLSDREIEVLTLVAAGFSNHDIGTRLFISDKTASVHVSHILRKLDASTRTEAATIGARLGLPDVERRPGSSG